MRVRTLLNPLSCPQRFSKQKWTEIFPNFTGTLDVEIGFGTGSFLDQYATANPTHALVGFEIRKKLVDWAQERITAQKLENVFLVWGNGTFGLHDMFEDKSIDRLFVFHPDPWPKRTHHKRRVLNQDFLTLAYTKLKHNGRLYVATDVPELWDFMLKNILISKKFTPIQDDYFWSTFYKTRWKEMSEEHNRSLFFGTFQAIEHPDSPISI